MNRSKSKTLRKILSLALAFGLLFIWLPTAALADGSDPAEPTVNNIVADPADPDAGDPLAVPADDSLVADPADPDADDPLQDPGAVLDESLDQAEAAQVADEAEGAEWTDGAVGLAAMQQPRSVAPLAYLVVEKIWDDDDDALGLRPDFVTVNIYHEGTLYESIVLDESNGWIDGLAIDCEFEAWSAYTVEELAVPNYITTVVSEMGEGGPWFTIINTVNPPVEDEFITVTIIKKWEDNNNAKGTRPSSVEVELYRDGTQIATVILNEANNWTSSIDGLPLYQDNDPDALSVYAVKEVSVAGYKVEVTAESLDMGVEFTIVNTADTPVESTPVKGTPIAKTSDSLAGLIFGLIALGAVGAGTAAYGLRKRNEK